jgi:hypothetical protein
MSMIQVLWHDSMMISSTEAVSHELRRFNPSIAFRLGDSCELRTLNVQPQDDVTGCPEPMTGANSVKRWSEDVDNRCRRVQTGGGLRGSLPGARASSRINQQPGIGRLGAAGQAPKPGPQVAATRPKVEGYHGVGGGLWRPDDHPRQR